MQCKCKSLNIKTKVPLRMQILRLFYPFPLTRKMTSHKFIYFTGILGSPISYVPTRSMAPKRTVFQDCVLWFKTCPREPKGRDRFGVKLNVRVWFWFRKNRLAYFIWYTVLFAFTKPSTKPFALYLHNEGSCEGEIAVYTCVDTGHAHSNIT